MESLHGGRRRLFACGIQCLMIEAIKSKRPPHIFLREWRKKHEGLSQERLGERIGANKAQVSNWESGERRPSSANQAALADALDIEVVDLFRHPDRPSADELLRAAPPDVFDKAIKMIRLLTGTEG